VGVSVFVDILRIWGSWAVKDRCLSPTRSAIQLTCCTLANFTGLGYCLLKLRQKWFRLCQRTGVLRHSRSLDEVIRIKKRIR